MLAELAQCIMNLWTIGPDVTHHQIWPVHNVIACQIAQCCGRGGIEPQTIKLQSLCFQVHDFTSRVTKR